MYQYLQRKGKYKYLWAKCQEDEVIRKAWRKLRKGKTKRREVKEIEADFDYYVERMKEMLKNTKPGDVEHPELAFRPKKYRESKIYEHGKEREKISPCIWEQWFHHIVIQVLAPIIMRVSHPYSVGSMPKRGGVYAKKHIEKMIKKHGFRNFLKTDVRHFFKHVRICYVIKMLRELIADEWFLYLVSVIFTYYQHGVPLGFYPSQWVANFLLYKLDWEIEKLNPVCYVRYVDDILICHNSKKMLHKILSLIKQHIGKLRLKLKNNYQICKFDYRRKDGKTIGRGIDFMGFLFKRKNTVLRKSIMLRTTHYAHRLKRLTVIASQQAASMLSRLGWFKHTDVYYVWKTRVKGCISVKMLKKLVSRKQRRMNHENRMENSLLPNVA